MPDVSTPERFYAEIVAEITRQMDGVRGAVLATILPNVLSTNAQVGSDAVKIDESFKRIGQLMTAGSEDAARDEQLAKAITDLQAQVKTLSEANKA